MNLRCDWLACFVFQDGSIHEAPSLTTPFCSYNPSDLGISIVGETSATAATVAAVTRHQLPDQSNLVKNLPDSNFLFATQGKGKMIESEWGIHLFFSLEKADKLEEG